MEEPSPASILRFVREARSTWLTMPNIVGVAVGRRCRGGIRTDELVVIFDVIAKFDNVADIVRARSRPIPSHVVVGDHLLGTDVREAWPRAHALPDLKARLEPVRGGCSVGNVSHTGTLGAVVRDVRGGGLVGLSNWHVLANQSRNGDTSQPGSGDDTGLPASRLLGRVTRNVFNGDVDAALTTLGARQIDPRICGLDVVVEGVAAPALGIRVVKCGKQTGVTWGIVTDPAKSVELMMPGVSDPYAVTVCVIEADPGREPQTAISDVGDSGACWMKVDPDGKPTGTMIGLHIGGDGTDTAYACHADRVFASLDIAPVGSVAPSAPAVSIMASGDEPHRVIARHGLRVRGGPGTQHDILAALPYGTGVGVVGREGEWAKVDLVGDGRIDGYMLASLLQPDP